MRFVLEISWIIARTGLYHVFLITICAVSLEEFPKSTDCQKTRNVKVRETIYAVRVTFARGLRVLSARVPTNIAYNISERSSKVKLGAVCGIRPGGGTRTKRVREAGEGVSIARTTWQGPSRLNEANSRPFPFHSSPSRSVFLVLFLPSFRPFYPVILLSLAAAVPTLSLQVELTPCRAHWARPRAHRPKSILGRRRELGNDDRAKEKDAIQITDRPGLSL